MTTELEQRIADMIEPTIDSMGFELVRVQISGSRRPTLQVMAEPADRRGMTVDDCAEISRALSALLDVEDPLPEGYMLEVSSPGLDRPLTRPGDFERFAGFVARIETRGLIDGRRRFTGRLLGLEDDQVVLRPEGGEDVRLALADIAKAKLVLTDDLIAAAQDAGAGTEEGE